MASTGIVEEFYETTDIVFEEKAGLVPITLRKLNDGLIWCELLAPENFLIGKTVSVDILASTISLTPDKIITNIHLPRVFSVGLPFLIAELTDLSSLEEASVNPEGFKKLVAQDITPYVNVYIRSDDEFDMLTQMFAPFEGMPEDPTTVSANCALGVLLGSYDDAKSGNFEWKIAQGIEMGRAIILTVRTQKKDGEVISMYIGGSSVMVSEGVIYYD